MRGGESSICCGGRHRCRVTDETVRGIEDVRCTNGSRTRGSETTVPEGESSMIRSWCLAIGAGLTLLVATSAAAQDRSADVQQPPIQARPGRTRGRTENRSDAGRDQGHAAGVEQQRRRGHRPLMGSRAGPRAGVAQRSRARRHPDRRHDAADSRPRDPRSGEPHRLSDHRSALDAGQSHRHISRIDHRRDNRRSHRRDRSRQRARRRRLGRDRGSLGRRHHHGRKGDRQGAGDDASTKASACRTSRAT